ncbi:MAG: DUF1566 domain-containing protein [Thermoanaerobaculaceae bacterium]|jgi:hypothetical protein|nr:DUF1566 domain-containing protein [Thermoanaerobaculaceae bacterium]
MSSRLALGGVILAHLVSIGVLAGLVACRDNVPGDDRSGAGGARSTPTVPPPTAPRFVSNDDGTVTDTHTTLTWAARDNGQDLNWESAKAYSESFSAGGHTDWRLPTVGELRSLYDPADSRIARCDSDPKSWRIHIAPAIDLSCYWVWSSETPDPTSAVYVLFDSGLTHQALRSYPLDGRALPVRSGSGSS